MFIVIPLSFLLIAVCVYLYIRYWYISVPLVIVLLISCLVYNHYYHSDAQPEPTAEQLKEIKYDKLRQRAYNRSRKFMYGTEAHYPTSKGR